MIYKHKFINIQVIWFDENFQINRDADMIRYRQVKTCVDNAEEFHTLIIDLTQTEEEIFNNFSKSNRKEIRKAIKQDDLVYKMYNLDITKELLDDFLKAQHDFAKERNLGEISKAEFMGYYLNKQLYISTIKQKNGEIISWRVHIVNNNRPRALVSNSFFINQDKEYKNLVGRASRLMRMKDIFYFKEKGMKIYDFGGWYAGSEDTKKLTINKYKEGFAQEKEISYNYSKCISIKCYIFKFLIFVKGRMFT